MVTSIDAPASRRAPARSGLREQKKRRTRKDLQRAAALLFTANGYDETTVDEIATVAGVSRRTLFRYFPTKESLAFPDTNARIARFQAALSGGPTGETPFDAVRRALLLQATEYMDERDELVALQRVIDASPALLVAERQYDFAWEAAIADALLASARRGRTESADADAARMQWARILAAATFGVVRTVVREWIADEGRGDLIAIGSAALDLLSEGFGLSDGGGARGGDGPSGGDAKRASATETTDGHGKTDGT